MTASWAREEFETIDLGDKRLDERLKMLAETLSDKPGASIPGACADQSTELNRSPAVQCL
jgi:hypothetical protein